LASHKSKALAEFEEERLEVFDDRRFDIGFMKLGLVREIQEVEHVRLLNDIYRLMNGLALIGYRNE
jgi:hypothetical protein